MRNYIIFRALKPARYALVSGFLGSILLVESSPAFAQSGQLEEEIPQATEEQLANEEKRLEAARRVVDRLIPKDDYAGYADGIVGPILDGINQQILALPQVAETIDSYPSTQSVFEEFIADERENGIALMVKSLPLLADAMTSAYANRLSLENLVALGDFLDTPAGKAYAGTSSTILSDPAIMSAQQKITEASFANIGERIKDLTRKLLDAVEADAQEESDSETTNEI